MWNHEERKANPANTVCAKGPDPPWNGNDAKHKNIAQHIFNKEVF